MAVARVATIDFATILTLVRELCNDEDSNAYRYSDAKALRALNRAIVHFWGLRMNMDYSAGLASVDLTYTGEGFELATVGLNTIVKVDDISITNRPVEIPWVPLTALENPRGGGYLFSGQTRRFTLLAPNDGVDEPMRMTMRPNPTTSLAIRVYYLIGPAETDETTAALAAGDNAPIPPRWFEFVALLAAEKLLAPQNEMTTQLYKLLADHQQKFLESGPSFVGYKDIPSKRTFR